MTEKPSAALVSRELYPFTGGGIAPMVAATAELMSEIADVTVVTTAFHREAYERLRDDPEERRRLPSDAVRFVFVEEPEDEDLLGYLSHMHGWSARVFEKLCELYPDGGPDLVEFPDYLAEGFVTVQARHSNDPRMRNATVCLRAYTTSEMVAVLNGRLTNEFATQAVWEAERYCLAHCDRFVHPGGNVYGTYRRFYGADGVARAHKAHHAVFGDIQPIWAVPRDSEHFAERPLRFLYFGRMERRKGVQNLLRALLSLDSDDWELHLLGADTDSAPMRASMRQYLIAMAGDNERVTFRDPVPRWGVLDLIQYCDVIVVPSLWECWPNTALEALSQNRPVLATPVGGLNEIVEPGASGWLTESADWRSLATEVERLLDARQEPKRLAVAGGPLQAYERLTDRDQILGSYEQLIALGRRGAPAPRRSQDVVSAIVPYFQLDAYVEETLASLAAQTYDRIEVVLVNDGSLRQQDSVVDELADRYGAKLVTQPNAGLGAARNFGISQASGRYVLPLDADDRLASTFVERCIEALEAERDAAYATSWSAYMTPAGRPHGDGVGWAPYGNWSSLIRRNNVAGTCTSVIHKRFFDQGFCYSDELTSYEDWFLYLELHEAGHYGVVVPERLIEYRVRPESMLRKVGSPSMAVIFDEINAHVRERAVRWDEAVG
jgi:glycogen synthase